jgi:hypothetical protein
MSNRTAISLFYSEKHWVWLDLRTIPRDADRNLQLVVRKQNLYLSALYTFTIGHLRQSNKTFHTDRTSTVKLRVCFNVKFESYIVRLMVQDSRKHRTNKL